MQREPAAAVGCLPPVAQDPSPQPPDIKVTSKAVSSRFLSVLIAVYLMDGEEGSFQRNEEQQKVGLVV